MPRPDGPCSLCGYRTRSKTGVCQACTFHDRHDGVVGPGLVGGQWVMRRGVQVWVEDSDPRLLPFTMSEEDRRAAHARFYLGQRDDATVLGEREYQRARKRLQRSVA